MYWPSIYWPTYYWTTPYPYWPGTVSAVGHAVITQAAYGAAITEAVLGATITEWPDPGGNV